jgi:hypothetical protein
MTEATSTLTRAEAFRSNFQGEKGLHAMEADVVQGFEKLVRSYETVQFMEGIKEAP